MEVDVFEGVDEAGHVVEVLEVGGSVLAGLVVPDRDGGSSGTEVDSIAADHDGAVVVEAVPGELLGRHADALLDQRPWEVEAFVVVDPPAGRYNDLDELGNGGAHAELLEHGERRVVDSAALRVGERLVGTARLAGADGLLVVGQAGGAGGYPGRSSPGTAGSIRLGGHARTRSLAGSWAGSSSTVAVWRSPNRVISKVDPGASKTGST